MVSGINQGSSVVRVADGNSTQRAPSAGLSAIPSTIQLTCGSCESHAGWTTRFCDWIGQVVSQLWNAIKRCCWKIPIPHEMREAEGRRLLDSHFALCSANVMPSGAFGMTVSLKYDNGVSSEIGNSGRALSASGLADFKEDCHQLLKTLVERDSNKSRNEGGLQVETRLFMRRADRKFQVYSMDDSIHFSNDEKKTMRRSDNYGVTQAEIEQHQAHFYSGIRGFEWSQI